MSATTYPTNLAQLRKYLQPGVTVYMVYRSLDGDQNPPRALTVHTADTVKVGWGGNSYHTFRKAKHYAFTTEGFSLNDYNGAGEWSTVARYTYGQPTPAPERTEEEITEEIIERQFDAEARERPIGTGDTPREPYRGEYYRAGSLPSTHAAHGAIVHRSPQHTGLFALVYGVKLNPIALVGPYACAQDAADNLAAWEIRLFRRLNAKHAIKADAERGKAMESGELKRRAVQPRAKLERVK